MCGGYWSSSRWLCPSVCLLASPSTRPAVSRPFGRSIHPSHNYFAVNWMVCGCYSNAFVSFFVVSVLMWFSFAILTTFCATFTSNPIPFDSVPFAFSSHHLSFCLDVRRARENLWKNNIKNRIRKKLLTRKNFKNILSFFFFFKILSLCFSSVLNNIWCFTTKVVSLHSAKISEFCSSISCLRHMCDSNFWRKKIEKQI